MRAKSAPFCRAVGNYGPNSGPAMARVEQEIANFRQSRCLTLAQLLNRVKLCLALPSGRISAAAIARGDRRKRKPAHPSTNSSRGTARLNDPPPLLQQLPDVIAGSRVRRPQIISAPCRAPDTLSCSDRVVVEIGQTVAPREQPAGWDVLRVERAPSRRITDSRR